MFVFYLLCFHIYKFSFFHILLKNLIFLLIHEKNLNLYIHMENDILIYYHSKHLVLIKIMINYYLLNYQKYLQFALLHLLNLYRLFLTKNFPYLLVQKTYHNTYDLIYLLNNNLLAFLHNL